MCELCYTNYSQFVTQIPPDRQLGFLTGTYRIFARKLTPDLDHFHNVSSLLCKPFNLPRRVLKAESEMHRRASRPGIAQPISPAMSGI